MCVANNPFICRTITPSLFDSRNSFVVTIIHQLKTTKMAAVNPYLNFSGNTEEAFNFYRSVFGTEFQHIMRFKDIPEEVPSPENNPDKIMHIALPIGNGTTILGSDRPDIFGPMHQGDNFHISISAETEEEAAKLFNGLSQGGSVTMPLEKAFWGSLFGMFIDKYGVQWMINYENSSF